MIHKEIPLAPRGAKTAGTLTTYFLDNDPSMDASRKRPVVIVCPGGGYRIVSAREAEPVAMRFVAAGCHAAVLRYAVAPEAKWPDASLQLAAAILHVREHAQEYHIDPAKVVVVGFSAGGHLAAAAGTLWNDPALYEALGADPRAIRPDAMILGYPVITSGLYTHGGSFANLTTGTPDARDEALASALSLETRVTSETPPAFLWHTASDPGVPVENSLLFFSALHRCGVEAALHIYPRGVHGLSLANVETRSSAGVGVEKECQSWVGLALEWLDTQLGIYEERED